MYVYHLLKYPTIVGFRQLRDNKLSELHEYYRAKGGPSGSSVIGEIYEN